MISLDFNTYLLRCSAVGMFVLPKYNLFFNFHADQHSNVICFAKKQNMSENAPRA